ncbi:2-phospho-L-lactate guanylyltransferase [Methanobrevibacter arboriphilus]|jgi:2-phospho-L-lactate guanylyltransferase|uniref:2-phospho-L-lactate guanylyltransferase n=1 Tax=Methanobrevibacter arboriphilus TaxID=39441 RepID=A0ACA8R2V8_METAZ|nr:2-phospho-L-lactate guanylyltransferase [Methanobrevibacter arboriphilus]BBL61462.1 2-phospho-L-lactate guanylyltransferase [Methanobrevibacter arboriphilus]GLI11207.1 2-phospho-L-lactate guanylyltransferase [Methanobrevibacter arboriphilus]
MDEIYAIIPVSRFSNAKTRLSPFLELKEREKLLKAMLKDVTKTLKSVVDEIVIISADKEVLEYANKLEVLTLVENEGLNLNTAISQAMDWCRHKTKKVFIVPSDIPLISKTNIDALIESAKALDFVIVPSKGGGTNGLIIKPLSIDMKFGEFSFKNHIKEANKNGFDPVIYDSFYMSLDVNIAEDLGEIMIHGSGCEAQSYLKDLKIGVESIHGAERLKVTRPD